MNNQQISKIISFFRINRSYHSPYTFILDGNFLVQLIQKSIDLQERLKPLVPGKYRIKVTNCTLQQLQILGEDFKLVLDQAKKMEHLKCGHQFQYVDKCILEHAEKQQSLIVCTQDKFLRRKLRGRNIAIMYFGPDQRITMEDIERHVMEGVKQQERKKFLPAEREKQELQQYHQEEKVLGKLKEKKQQRKMASQRGVQLKFIKKNVAKGPNPLSIKPKKIKQVTNQGQGPQKKKRIRKRKNKDRQRDNSQKVQ